MAQPPLKLGIVCYPTVGGSGVIATEMALHAAALGHDVHLISYGRPLRLRRGVQGLRYHAVDVSGYPLFRFPPYDLALATRMLEVQESEGIDLFHVHYAIPHAVSAYLARAMGGGRLRFVTTLHGTDITVVGADRAYMRPTRFALEQSDAITAVSRFLADETVLLFGTKKPIAVVPNFVDTQRYRPGQGARWAARPGNERVLVHASNFRPVKRVADVVRAFAAIARRIPAVLKLAGDGPDREHALAVALDLGVADRVEHLGNVEAMESVLGDADLFLLASETESFGLALLEAMACGVPCVSTDVGGVREVLGETGGLVPFADPQAMADAAVAILTDPDRYARLAKGARERAVELFDEAKVVPRYFEVYRQVLER
ncbi:MAG: N-acetyl-alpha-D-glucosaminyl L-malate synthase BshA [Planctomycetes bacterium]|nr:N-acetyl-alpha-D-glucosaminyl L-malate synthase BshA [Planctomycetota bacterium]